MIEFTDHRGWHREGEVWSPGPVASSVWVLITGEDGDQLAVPVKLPSKREPVAREIPWTFAPVGSMVADRWTKGRTPRLVEYTTDRYRDEHVNVPAAVSPAVWRRLVADQVAPEQLALALEPAGL